MSSQKNSADIKEEYERAVKQLNSFISSSSFPISLDDKFLTQILSGNSLKTLRELKLTFLEKKELKSLCNIQILNNYNNDLLSLTKNDLRTIEKDINVLRNNKTDNDKIINSEKESEASKLADAVSNFRKLIQKEGEIDKSLRSLYVGAQGASVDLSSIKKNIEDFETDVASLRGTINEINQIHSKVKNIENFEEDVTVSKKSSGCWSFLRKASVSRCITSKKQETSV